MPRRARVVDVAGGKAARAAPAGKIVGAAEAIHLALGVAGGQQRSVVELPLYFYDERFGYEPCTSDISSQMKPTNNALFWNPQINGC